MKEITYLQERSDGIYENICETETRNWPAEWHVLENFLRLLQFYTIFTILEGEGAGFMISKYYSIFLYISLKLFRFFPNMYTRLTKIVRNLFTTFHSTLPDLINGFLRYDQNF